MVQDQGSLKTINAGRPGVNITIETYQLIQEWGNLCDVKLQEANMCANYYMISDVDGISMALKPGAAAVEHIKNFTHRNSVQSSNEWELEI